MPETKTYALWEGGWKGKGQHVIIGSNGIRGSHAEKTFRSFAIRLGSVYIGDWRLPGGERRAIKKENRLAGGKDG